VKKFIIELLKTVYKGVDKVLKLLLSIIGIVYIIETKDFNNFIYYLLLIWWYLALLDYVWKILYINISDSKIQEP